jgi:hypothetical protein
MRQEHAKSNHEKIEMKKGKSLPPGIIADAGLSAGTLVHTKEGLVPIEQIKVGDFVLSKPENGGEQAYKRVLQTFAHAPVRVIQVGYIPDESKSIVHSITTTVNHPFWVVDLGWTAAEGLYRNLARENILVCDQPGVGWLPSHMGATDYPGALWDFVNHKLVATDVFAINRIRDEDAIAYRQDSSGELTLGEIQDQAVYLRLPVYNLEVENFHTYYVGKHGVWVHNANRCNCQFVQMPHNLTFNPDSAKARSRLTPR